MTLNFLIAAIAALIPMVMGFIWYHPKVLGTAWMNASGMTEEKMKGGNMLLIFGLSYVFALFISIELHVATIHQFHLFSLLMNEPGFADPSSEIGTMLAGMMEQYGGNFRTFGHGAFHGTILGFLIALPILATNALFERKGFKYIAVNAGYWIVTLALMGGVICQFA